MFWTSRLIFVHVPRTGGTVLTDAFGALPHVSKDVHLRKHLTALEARRDLMPIWEDARKIAVMRDDAAIARSWYEHVQRDARERTEEGRLRCTRDWWDFVTRSAGLSFEDFCQREHIPTMDYYCDLPEVERLPFADAVELLVELVGVPPEIPKWHVA